MHKFTKFRQNRSFRCRDIAIFLNFQDGRRSHLGFLKPQNFIVVRIQRVETHLHAKFCQNQSIGYKDIKIFQFFKMAAVGHLDLFGGIFGPPTVSTWGVSITLQSLVMIDAVVFII